MTAVPEGSAVVVLLSQASLCDGSDQRASCASRSSLGLDSSSSSSSVVEARKNAGGAAQRAIQLDHGARGF
jgi:hypothetical protein